MNWELYLLAFVFTPMLVLAIGGAAVYLHDRYMDRVDAEEARQRATRHPAE